MGKTEARGEKAERLLSEGRVERVEGTRGFLVGGDSGKHEIVVSRSGMLVCDCRAGYFGTGCSHGLAVEMWFDGRGAG